MNPKISVIIPVFNVEKYLSECLESVINQTLKDIEIICVDDGSTDGSKQILKEYAARESRIVVIEKENGGLSSARNAGLEVAKGEYVQFLDSDDLMEETAYEVLYNKAMALDLDVLYFEASSFFESDKLKNDNKDKETLYNRHCIYGIKNGKELFTELKKNDDYIVSACLQLIKTDLLKDIRFVEGIYYEDNPFSFTVISKAKRATCIADKLYLRRVREGSITTSQVTARHCISRLLCLKEVFVEASKHTYSSDQQIQVNDIIGILRWHAINAYQQLDDYNRVRYLDYAKLPENLLWHKYIIEGEINLRNKLEELKKTQRERDYRRSEYDRIEHSISYRIGRIVTFIPRKLRAGYKMARHMISSHVTINDAIAEKKAKSNIGRPHISVIIPVYNAERSINRALESLTNQTMKNIEIICVDDGSTDSSKEIIQQFAASDKRIKVLSQENKGAAEARNYGMDQAKGEFLLFLDADDYFYPELCYRAFLQAKIDRADICLFGARRRNVETGTLEDMGWVLKTKYLPKEKPFSPIAVKDNLFRITTACPWTKLYRGTFVKKTGIRYQNLSNANDVFFNRMNLALARKITYINVPLVEYSYNDSSSTQGRKNKEPTCFIAAFEVLKQELEKRNIYDTYKTAFIDMVKAETAFNIYSLRDNDAIQKCENALRNSGIKECFQR